MKVAVFALFPFFLFSSLCAQSSETLGPGAQSLALGNCRLLSEGSWRSYHHPAVLGQSEQKKIGLSLYSSTAQRGQGIHAHGVAARYCWNDQGIGLGLQKRAQPGIDDLVMHLGYGRKIFNALHIGICFERNSLHIPSESIRFAPAYSTAVSAHYRFSPLLAASGIWRHRHHKGWHNETPSSAFRVGLDWIANNNTEVMVEWGGVPSSLIQWHFGLLHRFRNGCAGFIGLGGLPLHLGWGFQWEERSLSIAISAMWSPARPGAGAVEIAYGS